MSGGTALEIILVFLTCFVLGAAIVGSGITALSNPSSTKSLQGGSRRRN